MKHLRNLTIGMMIAVMTVTQVAFAQTGDASGNGGAVVCRNGARDYGTFLSSVISYNGFTEYWKDIIVRYNHNMCLFLDIDNLLNRIDKTRQQIRNAFYTCDASAPKLRTLYYQLEAELFFLRDYVDFDDDGNIIFKSQNVITSDFTDYTVSKMNFFSPADAQTLLQTLFGKYNAKKDAYLNCADPTWGNLIQKWNEFKSSLGGFTAIQDAAETISKRWDDAVNTPFKRTGGLFGGLLDTKINGLDPATAWGDISAELQRNAISTVPVSSGQIAAATQQGTLGFSYDKFLQTAASDASLHDQELERTQFLAQYGQTYQQSSANIAQAIIDKVNALDTSIQATFPLITQTSQCAKTVNGRVC